MVQYIDKLLHCTRSNREYICPLACNLYTFIFLYRQRNFLLEILFFLISFIHMHSFFLRIRLYCIFSVSSVPEKNCGIPPKPLHGDHFLVYGPNDVLIALQYLCYRPYDLFGNPQRTCLGNNTWSGTAPTCVKGTVSSQLSIMGGNLP